MRILKIKKGIVFYLFEARNSWLKWFVFILRIISVSG